jgi:hypothetical protein
MFLVFTLLRVLIVAKSVEKRLREILSALPEEQVRQLLDFAEFLYERHGAAREVPAPVEIPRPESETVVAAIKRLRATYPMLDPARLLNETSVLMAQHVTQGRAAGEVIEELEVLFRSHYERSRKL